MGSKVAIGILGVLILGILFLYALYFMRFFEIGDFSAIRETPQGEASQTEQNNNSLDDAGLEQPTGNDAEQAPQEIVVPDIPDTYELHTARSYYSDLVDQLNEAIYWYNTTVSLGYNVEPHEDEMKRLASSVDEIGDLLEPVEMDNRDLGKIIEDILRLFVEIAQFEDAILDITE